MTTIVDRLKALDPHEFENLTYDLLLLEGMRNLVWRTPGADGGRDLEGERDIVDATGFRVTERWYVECKRYDAALNWPSVYEKCAYADNHDADYLHLVTTAKLSPTCKTEIDKRNKDRRGLRIRYWEGHALAQILQRHPLLLSKYALSDKVMAPSHRAVLPVVRLAQRIAQSTHAAIEMGGDPQMASEACAALLELVVKNVDLWDNPPSSRSLRVRRDDFYPWVNIAGGATDYAGLDGCSLRAILAYVRYATKSTSLDLTVQQGGLLLKQHPTSDGLSLVRVFSLSPVHETTDGLLIAKGG